MSKIALVTTLVVIVLGAGIAIAASLQTRAPVAFFKGHVHTEQGETIGAPEHSGGTDTFGCHNASVPYHCH